MKIAFIGLGAMGLPMAERLISAGHDVTGCDLDTRVGEHFQPFESDATQAARGAEMVIAMTVTGAQADAVLDAVIPSLAPASIFIASCTQSKADAELLGRKAEQAGLRFLDAPVSGGVKGAQTGTLSIMGSGPRATWDAAFPVLEAMGNKLFHMGDAYGLGSLAKTINQHLAGVHIVAAAEALALGTNAGLDGETMLKLYGGSAAASWILADRGPRMMQDAPDVASAIDIFVKDLGIVLDAAGDASVPLAQAAHALFKQASAQGLGRADDSQVIRVLRKTP